MLDPAALHPVRAEMPRHHGQRLDCRRRTSCLDVAIEQDWPGFSCTGCPAYQAIDRDQRRDDILGMSLLWSAVWAIRRRDEAAGVELEAE